MGTDDDPISHSGFAQKVSCRIQPELIRKIPTTTHSHWVACCTENPLHKPSATFKELAWRQPKVDLRALGGQVLREGFVQQVAVDVGARNIDVDASR